MILGIFLETSYYLKNSNLFCQDQYSKLFDNLKKDIELLYIGKINTVQPPHFNKIEKQSKFIELTHYSTIVSLILNFPLYYLKNRKALLNAVRSCDKVMVMTPGPISIVLLKLALKYHKQAIILVRHNSNVAIVSRFKGTKRIFAKLITNFLENRVLKFAKQNQSPVLALGDEIYSHYKVYSHKTVKFASSRYTLDNIIEKSKLKCINWDTGLKLLFVGRIEINKGLIELLYGLSNLHDINWTLDIIGEGTFIHEIERKIFELGLEDKINFMGYIPFGNNLLEEYTKHDILILPSYSEGLPQCVLEAMARGCMVVATRVGGIPQIIENGINGFLINPHSTDEITDKIRELKTTGVESSRICKNALETAKIYAQENQLNKMHNIIYS